jgi:3-hydroxybutyryl-CoA dehydrogenase
VQQLTGTTAAACLDINVMCTGFVYALELTRCLVSANPGTHAVVAGAGVIGAVDEGHSIIDVELDTRGDAEHLIKVPAGCSRNPASARTVADGGHYFTMRGRDVRGFVLDNDDLDSVGDCQFVLEAVGERLLDKLAIFGRLDWIVRDPDAVLATNTSSIPIMKIDSATQDPGRVVGVHFVNPVPAMALVELISSLHTAEATIDRASAFATEALGKQVIRCRDRPGFVVNALFIPYLLAAVRMPKCGTARK